MQRIIGCRPDFGGLVIDPCIPAKWKGFTLSREYRGVRYEITVENPRRVQHGVRELYVDGQLVPGNRIPHDAAKQVVRVRAVMG
jgi:cellobiose phosphorylase